MEKTNPELTFTDKALRELKLIQYIFRCQAEPGESLNNPIQVMDSGGKEATGYYIASLDIFSETELLYLHELKKHITERFETSRRLDLLNSQLQEIKKEAAAAIQYHNDYVVDRALQYQQKAKRAKFDKRIELSEHHSAVIAIDQSLTYGHLYLGASRTNWKFHRPKARNYPFNYIADNGLFLYYCRKLISFIDNIIFDKRTIKRPPLIMPFPDYLTLEFPESRLALADFLKKRFSGKKGKEIAYMIMALSYKGRRRIKFDYKSHLYNSIREYFGVDIGSDPSINKYLSIDTPPEQNNNFREIVSLIEEFIREQPLI